MLPYPVREHQAVVGPEDSPRHPRRLFQGGRRAPRQIIKIPTNHARLRQHSNAGQSGRNNARCRGGRGSTGHPDARMRGPVVQQGAARGGRGALPGKSVTIFSF